MTCGGKINLNMIFDRELAEARGEPTHFLCTCQVAPQITEETPIARLFQEFRRLHDRANEPGISEDECDLRVDAEVSLEEEIQRIAPRTVRDFAMKALIDVGFGAFDPSKEFWAEVCALAGIPKDQTLFLWE